MSDVFIQPSVEAKVARVSACVATRVDGGRATGEAAVTEDMRGGGGGIITGVNEVTGGM